jgi:putative oxidoreductase
MGEMRVASTIKFSSRWTLLPLRVVIGFGFLAHGLAKLGRGPEKFGLLLQVLGVPFHLAMAWITTATEIAGGAALLLGAFVTLASIPLIVTMLVAMFTIHVHNGFSAVNTIGLTPTGPIFGPPGYEISLLYIGGLLALALSGPTAMSVDRLREGEDQGTRRTSVQQE